MLAAFLLASKKDVAVIKKQTNFPESQSDEANQKSKIIFANNFFFIEQGMWKQGIPLNFIETKFFVFSIEAFKCIQFHKNEDKHHN